MSPMPTFHIKTCRNCKGKDPCTCSIGHNHAFSCCNAGRITLGPMDGYAPPGDEQQTRAPAKRQRPTH